MSSARPNAFSRAKKAGAAKVSTSNTKPSVLTGRKFTVLFDASSADDFDSLVLEARRQSGRRIDKSEVVRALIDLTRNDPDLLQRVIDHPTTQ